MTLFARPAPPALAAIVAANSPALVDEQRQLLQLMAARLDEVESLSIMLAERLRASEAENRRLQGALDERSDASTAILDRVRQHVVCPLSHKPMADPVFLPESGCCYERARIASHVRTHHTCQVTGLPSHGWPVPARAVKAIADLLAEIDI